MGGTRNRSIYCRTQQERSEMSAFIIRSGSNLSAFCRSNRVVIGCIVLKRSCAAQVRQGLT